MDWGLCVGGDILRENNANKAWQGFWDTLQSASIAYLELPVGSLMADDNEFAALHQTLEDSPVPVRAFNVFLPGTVPITGPNVDLAAALDYAQRALIRCRAVGGQVVCLGSAGARRVPAGFDHTVAARQFLKFGRELGPVASEIGIDIAVEPLSSAEDNLLFSVAQGVDWVEKIGQASIGLLPDLYHMSHEHEPMASVAEAGNCVIHAHLADIGRTTPGFAADGEADFLGFFRALRAAGYDKRTPPRCSFEGNMADWKLRVASMVTFLNKRWAESARLD